VWLWHESRDASPRQYSRRQYFPLGKAYGKAFCNRLEETEMLVGNIQAGKHTLLIAPRRFGKSSLAERAITKSKLPSVKLNFHLCTSDEEIAELVIDGVVKLIGSAVGQVGKLIASIKKYLSHLEPSLSFGQDIAQLKLLPKHQSNHAVAITEALLLLEKLLREKKKRAVIFFDEFQEINRVSKHSGIEGAFRTAAQEMQNISIIFSGSIRSLLLSMFEDENRPLYKLCRKIKLGRISSTCYEKHIQAIAKHTWKSELTSEIFQDIMMLSNRHPYYVNYLCDGIWEYCKKNPTKKDIVRAWQRVITEEWSDALHELSDLPLGQRRLLKYIANNQTKTLQSQETSHQIAMPASSIATAANTLTEKDYIEKDISGCYEVINPLLYAVLQGAQD